MKLFPDGAVDAPETDPADVSAGNLGGDNDQDLLVAASSHCRALRRASIKTTQHGFVNLDFTFELVPPWTYHCPSQLVMSGPGSPVAPEPEDAL